MLATIRCRVFCPPDWSRNVKVIIYKTIILPVVLYGCETWSLTLREEDRLRVFENRVLRRIFGPKRDEVTVEWRKLNNEELHNLYSLPDIIKHNKSRRMRWAGHVARMGGGEPSGSGTTVLVRENKLQTHGQKSDQSPSGTLV
jgi:hypothetical protein